MVHHGTTTLYYFVVRSWQVHAGASLLLHEPIAQDCTGNHWRSLLQHDATIISKFALPGIQMALASVAFRSNHMQPCHKLEYKQIVNDMNCIQQQHAHFQILQILQQPQYQMAADGCSINPKTQQSTTGYNKFVNGKTMDNAIICNPTWPADGTEAPSNTKCIQTDPNEIKTNIVCLMSAVSSYLTCRWNSNGQQHLAYIRPSLKDL